MWGRLSAGVGAARASQQASFADLASARLSAQGELAVNYFNLRSLDVQRALSARTVQGYERSLTITNNRYNAGVAARTDLLQAQSQLANARADLLDLQRQRAQLEHAIAVLVGQAPASFSLPAEPTWALTVPAVPPEVPSTLLQRRPDIAAAERRVAQANEQIGIARAAYFPSLRLSGSLGAGASAIGDLFNASSLVWALGASAAQTLFNAGLTGAQVEGARAAFDESVARYRQTVLTAFQDVEDQLAASRILGEQLALRQEASEAADLVEQQVLNRYQAGQVAFTDVVTAQNTAQQARRALVQLQASRQVAAVSLIQALGGGWQGLGSEGAAQAAPPKTGSLTASAGDQHLPATQADPGQRERSDQVHRRQRQGLADAVGLQQLHGFHREGGERGERAQEAGDEREPPHRIEAGVGLEHGDQHADEPAAREVGGQRADRQPVRAGVEPQRQLPAGEGAERGADAKQRQPAASSLVLAHQRQDAGLQAFHPCRQRGRRLLGHLHVALEGGHQGRPVGVVQQHAGERGLQHLHLGDQRELVVLQGVDVLGLFEQLLLEVGGVFHTGQCSRGDRVHPARSMRRGSRRRLLRQRGRSGRRPSRFQRAHPSHSSLAWPRRDWRWRARR